MEADMGETDPLVDTDGDDLRTVKIPMTRVVDFGEITRACRH